MVVIKKYEPKYFEDVRQVCINTGPKEASTDPDMRDFILFTFCDYYLEQEPENAFILVDEETDTAQGYVFGARDFKTYIKNMKPYLKKVKKTGKANYIAAIGEILGHAIYSFRYPAHLHIDINEPFRGNGNGSRMISTLTEHMKKNKGVKSIMLIVGTSNKRGINFYNKNGFKTVRVLKGGTVMAKEL